MNRYLQLFWYEFTTTLANPHCWLCAGIVVVGLWALGWIV